MSDTILLILFVATATATVLIKALMTPRARVHTSVQAIRALLSPPDLPISALLRARAIPNQRLVKALGISSTFVSDDPHVHDGFTREAKALITAVSAKDNGDGWSRLIDVAESCVNRFLDTKGLDYATFVQSVTFSIILGGLLGADIETLGPTEVLDHINDHITRWVPDRENPLNIIIPAYETMWRVAATAVVYSNRDQMLREAFLLYNENPTDDQFRAATWQGKGKKPSVEAIISEVLRLHPPTRHITRSVDIAWWKRAFVPSVEVADVEEVQKSHFYGNEPESFNPMRFHENYAGTKRDQLYAFGHGKLRCVAASWAPSAAAVITAKIIVKMEEEKLKLKEGPRIGKREGWEGWCIERS